MTDVSEKLSQGAVHTSVCCFSLSSSLSGPAFSSPAFSVPPPLRLVNAGPNLRFKLPSTGPMASAERESLTGVWRRSPQRGPEAEPLVRGGSPLKPEAEKLLACQHLAKAAKFTPLTEFGKLSACDVSTTLNRISNTSLLRTVVLKQLVL